MNTHKNNKTIAEFMGHIWETECPFEQDDFDNREMNYHTSWDWLMPVVEKIKNVGFAPDKMYNEKSIDYILTNNFSKTNLYHAVVEFINQHNK